MKTEEKLTLEDISVHALNLTGLIDPEQENAEFHRCIQRFELTFGTSQFSYWLWKHKNFLEN